MRTNKLVFTIFASVAAVKPIVVDAVYGWLAGSMKQLPLIVLLAIFIIHGLLFDLIVLPQVRVLDSLNLKQDKTLKLRKVPVVIR